MKDRVLKKREEYINRNILTPTVQMIKSLEQIEGIKDAGIVNSKILDFAQKNIKVGMTTFELDKMILDYTLKNNAKSAILGYDDFSGASCISINSCVAHGLPSTRIIINEGDLVKIDCTTIYNGYYADACRSIVVGKNETASRLVEINKIIINGLVSIIKPYETYLGDIGAYISKEAKKYGLNVILELGGHGVGLEFHEEPFIDSSAEEKTGILLMPGMVFTLEPIFVLGDNKIKQYAGGIHTVDKSLSSQIEYTVVILEDKAHVISS